MHMTVTTAIPPSLNGRLMARTLAAASPPYVELHGCFGLAPSNKQVTHWLAFFLVAILAMMVGFAWVGWIARVFPKEQMKALAEQSRSKSTTLTRERHITGEVPDGYLTGRRVVSS